MNFLYILDLIGCCACAAAGSVLAKKAGFDFLGAIMVGAVGGIGGGTCRDLLINRHPLFWLTDLNYLYVMTITSLLVQIFYFKVQKFFSKPLILFDAVGLSAFAIIGFEAALSKDLSFPIVVLMGVFTAVNGGIMRDIICGEKPLVLHKEIYISCVIVGGIIYLSLLANGISLAIRDLITFFVIFFLRLLAIYRQWNLPSITIREK